MRKKLFLLMLFGITFLLLGCEDMVLEYESVDRFTLEEITENGTVYQMISGHSLHSALNVKEIKEKQDGEDIVILVYLTLSRKDETSSGTFKYKIELNEKVSRILFGKNKKVIWERG